jgi:hypothetical protein
VEVILDQDTGSVYVKRESTPPGVAAQHTHQFSKFGVTLVWDGHGNLLGVGFDSENHEPAEVLTISNDEPTQPGMVTTSA